MPSKLACDTETDLARQVNFPEAGSCRFAKLKQKSSKPKPRLALRVRGHEHCDAVRLEHCSKSAVAEHAHNYEVPHEVDWNSLKVADKSKNRAERKVQEGPNISTY